MEAGLIAGRILYGDGRFQLRWCVNLDFARYQSRRTRANTSAIPSAQAKSSRALKGVQLDDHTAHVIESPKRYLLT